MKYYFEVIKYEIIMLPQLLRYLFSFKKKVLYVGCTGMGNLGDEVVYEATKSLLNQKFIFYKILYSKPNAGKIARKIFIKSPSYIFLGGGTIIKKGIDSGYLKLFVKLHNEYPKAKLIVFGAGVADPILAKEIEAQNLERLRNNQVEMVAELSKKEKDQPGLILLSALLLMM